MILFSISSQFRYNIFCILLDEQHWITLLEALEANLLGDLKTQKAYEIKVLNIGICFDDQCLLGKKSRTKECQSKNTVCYSVGYVLLAN